MKPDVKKKLILAVPLMTTGVVLMTVAILLWTLRSGTGSGGESDGGIASLVIVFVLGLALDLFGVFLLIRR